MEYTESILITCYFSLQTLHYSFPPQENKKNKKIIIQQVYEMEPWTSVECLTGFLFLINEQNVITD